MAEIVRDYTPRRVLRVVIEHRVKRILAEYKLEGEVVKGGMKVNVEVNSLAMFKLLGAGVKGIRGEDGGVLLVY